MIKKICSIFLVTVFCAGLHSSAIAQNCTAIDALTTATLKLTNQSAVCENTADLVFTYNKINGSRPFSYGKTTSYGKNGGDISGVSRKTTIKLNELESETKYYFKVEGIYEPDGGLIYTMTGSFTTNKPAAGVVSTYKTTPKTIITIGKNKVAISASSDKVLSVQLFSINGSLVFNHYVNVLNQVASISAGQFRGNGTYLCKITGATTSQKQVVTILK